ncbi:hypothetical protein [Cyclobacterium xiamenense]|uniref:hypothetical protein n=1 Tax=Cyclobacterium xiamenense TaxID=1297121 RepID=UPI0035D0FF83
MTEKTKVIALAAAHVGGWLKKKAEDLKNIPFGTLGFAVNSSYLLWPQATIETKFK